MHPYAVTRASLSSDRNVILADYYGNVVAGLSLHLARSGPPLMLRPAGFYQYGTVIWTTFFKWLAFILPSLEPWIIVQGDRFDAEQYFPSSDVVIPGKYILLAPGACPSPSAP